MAKLESASRISRRAFLGAAGSAAWMVAGGIPALAAKPGVSTRNALFIPPTTSPSALALTAAASTVDLGGGSTSRAWTYNGLLPGPTIRARTGDSAGIALSNALASEPTIVHWHGMLVSYENDGHPRYAIPPGGTYSYSFPIANRASLYWYHPHPHQLTGEQVALGLAGAFVVNDAAEDALGLPAGVRELVLILRDASLTTSGDLQYKPRSGGFLGNIALVNGTRDAYVNVDTALYRLRILDGANARIFRLALSNGDPFVLIGNDGGLLGSAVPVSTPDIAPAERLDLLVDFRGLPVGSSVMLRDLRSGWDLLEFRVTRSVADTSTVPTTLVPIAKLTGPVRTRTFSFDGMSKINGLEYQMDRIDFTVPFGQVERWRFATNGNAPHPIHVHGVQFQVESRTGGRRQLFPWESGWKDTVLLEDRETVDVLVRFDAYRGEYLLHCHKLEHEDMGMMSNFVVT